MKILVADDATSIRHVILHLLRTMGYIDVKEAANGIQALQMLRSTSFDLVITDINMPKLDGKELLIKIRSDGKLKHLPVLFVSSESGKEKLREILNYQPNGYILKPFNVEKLQKQIKRIEKLLAKESIKKQVC